MRPYRAATILLPRWLLTHRRRDRGVGVPAQAMEEIYGGAYRLSNPVGPFARVAGAGEVVDKPESVTAAA
jgi:hypothetical protein